MSIRLFLATLIFLMAQAVLFGFGIIGVLAGPVADQAMVLIPVVTVVSSVFAAIIAWRVAVYLRTHERGWRLAG